MRDELMTEAICWDLGHKVMAEYAHSQKNLTYYCPHEMCVREVYAAQRKNTYFVAEDRHVPGCPNETGVIQSSSPMGIAAKKESVVPALPIPNVLGPNSVPSRKVKKPTIEELRRLALSLNDQKPYCAGTFVDVVAAWEGLPKNERGVMPLRISGTDLTYASAFYFLGQAGDQIQDIPWGSKIVFGAARVTKSQSKNCYFVTTAKKFTHQDTRLGILARIPASDPAIDRWFSSLVGIECTVFYLGSIPTVSSTRKSFMVPEYNDDYKGVIVLNGAFLP